MLAAGNRHLNDDEQPYLRLLKQGECMFLVLEKSTTLHDPRMHERFEIRVGEKIQIIEMRAHELTMTMGLR